MEHPMQLCIYEQRKCFISVTLPGTCNKYFPGTQGKKKIQYKEMDVPLSSRSTEKNHIVLSSLGKRQAMSLPSLTVGKLQVLKLAK